jgi:type II secretory pathway pseudopilin PulG
MKRTNALIRNNRGISLVELIIVMALVVIVLAMNTDTLRVIFRQSRQQTQAAGSEMERLLGLEILRVDVEHAGYGLPWSFQNAGLINYSEVTANPYSSNDAPANPPRALLNANNPSSTFNLADYLVVKSSMVAANSASQKWTYAIAGQTPHVWGASNDLVNNDRVVSLFENTASVLDKRLVMNGAVFAATYSVTAGATFPGNQSERYAIYGVDPDTDLSMPFNRADYYISRPSPMPRACAPGTGILYKATANQSGGGLNPQPIIDCVADMEIIFRLDTNEDGLIDTAINDLGTRNARQIREQVKEVRIYILSHEGERDTSFRYASNPVTPNIVTVGEFGQGRDFDLASAIGAGWANYRWKVDSLVIQPRNLLW